MLVRIEQVRDPDAAIGSPVPIPQVGTDASLRRLGVRVIAVIQNHLLHVTEDRFHGVVVRAPFGQGDPVQPAIAPAAASTGKGGTPSKPPMPSALPATPSAPWC